MSREKKLLSIQVRIGGCGWKGVKDCRIRVKDLVRRGEAVGIAGVGRVGGGVMIVGPRKRGR